MVDTPITRLKACAALEEKATAGPWKIKALKGMGFDQLQDSNGNAIADTTHFEKTGGILLFDNDYVGQAVPDAQIDGSVRLVVALRNSIPDLTFVLARLEECERALTEIADRLNCRGDPTSAHYCPNCDNSLYNVREIARAALEPKRTITPEG